MNMNDYDVLFLEGNFMKTSVLESVTTLGWNFRGILPYHAKIEKDIRSLAVMDISDDALLKVSECTELLRC